MEKLISTGPEKVIFLDIDGVLNSNRSRTNHCGRYGKEIGSYCQENRGTSCFKGDFW